MNTLKVQQDSYKNTESWTDDLPVCKLSGMGFSTNQIYREDGHPQEDHPYEDTSSHFQFNDHFCLYTVFDGHEGKKCADFCSQRLTAELYFNQIDEKETDEEVIEIIKQAFITVERGYMDALNDLLALRMSLQCDIPEGLSCYEAYQKMPDLMEQIKRINVDLAAGTAAAVALICKNKLYVANVGNCRVLLCQTDSNNVLKVVQLSVDHDLKNEDETLRLSQIGIKPHVIRSCSRLGNQDNTRCLGNYLIKGGYKEFEDLAMATQEPVISEPDIHGGILLDDSCRFLLLMTAGLYKCVEEAIGSDQVNKYIAQWVVEQFREQATLTGVAQAVVDKVVRLHHDWYMSNSCNNSCTPKREDITLVLRNFNFPMPNALKSPTKPSVQFNSVVVMKEIGESSSNLSLHTLTNASSASSDSKANREEVLGPDQRIPGYVDYGFFYENFNRRLKSGQLPDCLL
ncbi:hypothetical protein ABEB36_011606 [Hypothenemus hampei]|uniref:TGF-beta-activated kinase 1 and MAP3K7-binding protein 1 n=1 Tax=Hypothenemus hampei TaxID=57062 RepID=A0ABD1EAI1_HYPHA